MTDLTELPDPMRFDGQTVVITGAGRGIGRSYALLLGERGASVVVNDKGIAVDGSGSSPDPAREVAAAIVAQGGRAIANWSDISTVGGAKDLIAQTRSEFGPVDILVHNAGFNIGDFDQIFDVHVRAAWWLTEEVWPEMVSRQYGRIVLTTSSAGLYGDGTGPGDNPKQPYATAKAAIVGLTKSLAIRGRPANVMVNAVSPSAYTRLVELNRGLSNTRLGAPPPEAAIEFSKRHSPAQLVAAGAAFLMHPSCPVTGRVFNIGAGRVAEVFAGVTSGYVAPDVLTPEDVVANFDQVVDLTDFNVPVDMGDHGSWVRQVLAGGGHAGRPQGALLHQALAAATGVSVAQRALRRHLVRDLEPRLVELLILRHAAVTNNSYCWSHHEGPARQAGLTTEEINAIADGKAEVLPVRDALAIEFVDGLLKGSVDPDLRERIRACFDDAGLVKVVMLVGYYSMIGQARVGLGIALDDEAATIPAGIVSAAEPNG